jgi:hypothetical protein
MRYVGSKGPDLLELTPKLLNHLCDLKLAAIEKRYNMVLSNPDGGRVTNPPSTLFQRSAERADLRRLNAIPKVFAVVQRCELLEQPNTLNNNTEKANERYNYYFSRLSTFRSY